jgi:hypothetical protein
VREFLTRAKCCRRRVFFRTMSRSTARKKTKHSARDRDTILPTHYDDIDPIEVPDKALRVNLPAPATPAPVRATWLGGRVGKGCFMILIGMLLLHLGLEFYETSQLASDATLGASSADDAGLVDKLFNLAIGKPLGSNANGSLTNADISPFAVDGFCIDINTVPRADLRTAFPTKVFEVSSRFAIVATLLLYCLQYK